MPKPPAELDTEYTYARPKDGPRNGYDHNYRRRIDADAAKQ